ncbi:hypothetical protein ACHAXR_010487 [Thalassiosira sp. AJA248-18]
MPATQSSGDGDGDDTTASRESDTLICGFGPRRARGDSTSVDSSDNLFGTSSDGIINVKDMQSSLICGFGCDGNSYGSGSSGGDIFAARENRIIYSDTTNNTEGCTVSVSREDTRLENGKRTTPLSLHKEKKGHSSSNDSASTDQDIVPAAHCTSIPIPTKTTENSREDSINLAVPRMDSSKSISSEGEMSMASEDAVVLMINMLDEVDEDWGEKDKVDKISSQDKVCGRVFKRQYTNDYESIPIELEIDNGARDQSWPSLPINLGADKHMSISEKEKHRLVPEEDWMTSKSHRPISNPQPLSPKAAKTGLSQHQKQQSHKTGSTLAKHVSINNSTTYIEENRGNNIVKGRNICSKASVSFQSLSNNYTTGFPSAVDQVQQRRRSSGVDQNLDVIREDDNDSSTAATDLKNSFVSQATGSSKVSDASSSGDASFSSSSRLNPIGEHAKSMARQLKMDTIVDASPRGAPMKRIHFHLRNDSLLNLSVHDPYIHEGTSKQKKRLQEEGRLAIVSRNSETEYVKVVTPKPESVKRLIHDAIAANILFKACSSEEIAELVEVFAPSEASAGSTIIREGDEGDAFYVMERGTIDVYEGDTHKATLYSGTSFGEIALLYGCPRSATLRTRYFCKLWSIGRSAFRDITSQFKQRQMEAKVKFLMKVKIKDKFLSDVLSESEINTLALATLNESYEAGHIIVREGEPGDIFYMIDSGSVDVLIKAKGDAPVVTLTSGQFFGELALLSNDVRTASCVAKTDVKCHILMRNDFNLLLGDLQSLMDGGDYRRREEEYIQPKKASKVSLQVDLSDLDILKVLGIGAFGRVRLAKLKHPVNDIKNDDGFFALKCISKQSLKENGLDSHILNEKAIMSSLEHPFINRYYCDMEDEKYLYFLLEALPGGELCKRLREEKQFPEPWGKFYSASVLFAFCHMHAKKIAYRDLKPENLVMDFIGYVKVVDFGLAKVIDGGKTWTLCGTPAYLAPEIVLNDGHDWAVDYWALGVFLFEMTSGREPFAAKNPMEVYKQIVSGHVEIPSYFSPTLTDLIMKLLNTSKSKRLGRTMGGGGAVMQHRWYSDFDWDAHLEKRLEVPLQPKTQEILCEDSVASDSRDSSVPSTNPRLSLAKQSQNQCNTRSMKPPRLTYSLGQGNRHHQKLLEMMDNSCGEHNDSEHQVDTVRMTMMRVIKQHERWSRTSRESTNSSTRNTSLGVGVGPKMSTRSSVNTESGASVASSGFGENLDAFLRLQLMHLSLASKRFSQNLERDRAYQQFSLLSICSSSLINENSELRDCGHCFLDPFITKKVHLVDQFPSGLSESDIDAEALAAFCFPNGLRIRLVPRCAEEGAKRLERRRSVAVIARWWRKQFRRPERLQSGPIFGSKPMVKRANSMVEKASSMKWGRKGSDEESHRKSEDRNSAAGLRAAMDKVMSMNRSRKGKFKSASMGDLAFDESDHSDEDSFGVDYGGEEFIPPSEHVRRLGRSAYQAMIDAEKEGDICIIEKCYVLTGTRLQDQSLFFCALQNLIDMERKINDKAVRMTAFKRRSVHMIDENGGNHQQSEGTHYSFDPENRQAVLSALQSKLSLTPLQRRISYPRNEMAHVNNPQRRFVMDLSIMGFSKISLPLPLPEVSSQWGLSTLFLRIKDSGLIILLKLLLLERSVLVVGETSEEVTACTTALLELLDPYKWASAFMPLLPRDMLDFVSSPVPFIAGMIVEGKQHLHRIIHDHGVKDAMLHGLSIVNLVSGKLIVTREQGTSDMLRRSFQTIPELSLYQKRLEEYCKSSTSNLRSFQSFFKHGASQKESLTLRKIKNVIKKHMSQFTMGLSDKPDAWQQYGEFNEATGTFDFCPDKFIQPLKDRMIFQIQFQEMMAHTQLFVGYVEELQLAHDKQSNLLSGPAAKFIARWVELHWHAKYSR